MAFRNEHEPYEIALLAAAAVVEPFGEDRADLRAAVNTSRLVMALSAKKMDDVDIDKLIKSTQFYLDCNQPKEVFVSPDEAVKKIGVN